MSPTKNDLSYIKESSKRKALDREFPHILAFLPTDPLRLRFNLKYIKKDLCKRTKEAFYGANGSLWRRKPFGQFKVGFWEILGRHVSRLPPLRSASSRLSFSFSLFLSTNMFSSSLCSYNRLQKVLLSPFFVRTTLIQA